MENKELTAEEIISKYNSLPLEFIKNKTDENWHELKTLNKEMLEMLIKTKEHLIGISGFYKSPALQQRIKNIQSLIDKQKP